jgi:hypothetical protein
MALHAAHNFGASHVRHLPLPPRRLSIWRRCEAPALGEFPLSHFGTCARFKMRMANHFLRRRNSDRLRRPSVPDFARSSQLRETLEFIARFAARARCAKLAERTPESIAGTGRRLALSCGHGGGPGEDGRAQKPRLPAKIRHCDTCRDIDAGVR